MAWDRLFSGRGGSAPPPESNSEESVSAASPAESNAPEARRDPRRSKRVYIAMPVIIKGQRGTEAFKEHAATESVNANGCMIRMATAVKRGQKLMLTNVKSSEEIECRVTYLGQSEGGKTQAGLEFGRAAEYFWHIAFPPDDWNPAERKKPVVGGAPRKHS